MYCAHTNGYSSEQTADSALAAANLYAIHEVQV
jgi:hypothetical protein